MPVVRLSYPRGALTQAQKRHLVRDLTGSRPRQDAVVTSPA